MLVDKQANRTYSSRKDAIRQIGEKEYNKKVKNNLIEYVQCYMTDK